jgi:hypothetical protein
MTFAFGITDWNFREAPGLSSDEFAKSFAICGLSKAISDFGCGPFEFDGLARWYWKTALTWPKMENQVEFDRYARQRVADRVGYTRRYHECCSVIDRLYDKARGVGVDFDEVIDAIAFLSKPEAIPESKIQQNGETTLVDMTQRSDFPKLLKIDAAFLPVLRRLWPLDIIRVGHTDVVSKRIAIGSIVRDFPIYKLVYWQQHPQDTRVELDESVESRNGDGLDLRAVNLISLWAERAKIDAASVPDEFSEGVGPGGTRFLLRENNGGKSLRRNSAKIVSKTSRKRTARAA